MGKFFYPFLQEIAAYAACGIGQAKAVAFSLPEVYEARTLQELPVLEKEERKGSLWIL